MKGIRVSTFGELAETLGSYMKDSDGNWWAHCPDTRCAPGMLSDHEVNEHEDGTITVSPSLLMPFKDNSGSWHGYLKAGEWTE